MGFDYRTFGEGIFSGAAEDKVELEVLVTTLLP